MALELKAKVIQINPEIQGNGRNGTWRKQEIIVETGGNYPKKVCVSVWGDKIDQFGLNIGSEQTFLIDVESREYNGRWYTDVKAYDLKSGSEGAPQGGRSNHNDQEWSQKSTQIKSQNDMMWVDDSQDDDLPF
ncbi:DUF3127 domain-containing protein [bacterium]|nr:MAG: DUF3127 domain-containing protein [bacterium]